MSASSESAAALVAATKTHYYSLLYNEMAERRRAEAELRMNNALLTLLSNAQLQFVSGMDADRIFANLLDGLLDLSASEEGFIWEVPAVEGQTGPPRPIRVHLARGGRHNDLARVMEKLYRLTLRNREPLSWSQRPGQIGDEKIQGWLPDSYLGLIFYQGERAVGVVGIANRPGGYGEPWVKFLQPVLSTCGQLVVAHRNEQLRREAEAALAAERASLAQRVAERTAELSAANAELARASRAKDDFLASMSHELRTPLNAILFLAQALKKGVYGPISDKQLRSVLNIEESGRHLLSLINDILDVAKIEAGRLELDIWPVAVEPIAQASLRLIKEMAEKKQIAVSLQLDPAVSTVRADDKRLTQILVNLLSNAVKFTDPGGSVGLEVKGDPANQRVHFTVWDTGIGIAEEDLPKLFKPFTQLDSGYTRQYSGTGLGLSLVYRMTQMHGGEISVESQVGQGSRFTVSLPWEPEPAEGTVAGTIQLREGIQAASAGVEQTEEAQGNGTSSELPQNRPSRILLAEDNDLNAEALSDYLHLEGFQVLLAKNGQEAIDRARSEGPDLILMDIQMPVMDGLEAIRRIRADKSLDDMPIIALTALAMAGDAERCLQAGADDYISKPIDVDTLLAMIGVQLERRQNARQK
ncbi:response regulator [Litorilinea aerophila]|uniref:ATP-binding response regulator n=1 Tax=Litorilinea aerophila TaxID=1204385 RepID=UPI001476FA01|nr:ATP-binding protein [Litorilinea aerophila]MCC9077469.1 response regulator [Litorilinea aerophila]